MNIMEVFNILLVTYSASLVLITGICMFKNKKINQEYIPNTECDLS